MAVHDRRAIAALWFAIWLLIAVGLSTSVVATIEKLRPEIVLETCSLLAALFLVIVERLTTRNSARSHALKMVAEELQANARTLCSGVWAMNAEELSKELDDLRSGFRFYYTHLSVTGVSEAILGSTFDAVADVDLVTSLQKWRVVAEECNSRLGMGQRFLFFLPPTVEGIRERLEIHASIAELPIVKARQALREVSEYLLGLGLHGSIPDASARRMEETVALLADDDSVVASTQALVDLIEHMSS